MNDDQVEFWKNKSKEWELLFLEQKRICQEYRKLTDDYHEKLDAERSKREDSECDFCEGNCKCGLRQKNHLFITETIKNEEIVHKGPITFIV